MIRSNNINKYYSLENYYIKINLIKSNDEIKYQCLEISKHVFSSEGEPLAGKTILTQGDLLIFHPEFFGKKRKCYMSEIFYIKRVEIKRLFYYNKKEEYNACSY